MIAYKKPGDSYPLSPGFLFLWIVDSDIDIAAVGLNSELLATVVDRPDDMVARLTGDDFRLSRLPALHELQGNHYTGRKGIDQARIKLQQKTLALGNRHYCNRTRTHNRTLPHWL